MTIYWRLAELLEERGMTAYALAKATGLTTSAVYKLARKKTADRIEAPTLDLLCRALNCQPGDLLRYKR